MYSLRVSMNLLAHEEQSKKIIEDMMHNTMKQSLEAVKYNLYPSAEILDVETELMDDLEPLLSVGRRYGPSDFISLSYMGEGSLLLHEVDSIRDLNLLKLRDPEMFSDPNIFVCYDLRIRFIGAIFFKPSVSLDNPRFSFEAPQSAVEFVTKELQEVFRVAQHLECENKPSFVLAKAHKVEDMVARVTIDDWNRFKLMQPMLAQILKDKDLEEEVVIPLEQTKDIIKRYVEPL